MIEEMQHPIGNAVGSIDAKGQSIKLLTRGG